MSAKHRVARFKSWVVVLLLVGCSRTAPPPASFPPQTTLALAASPSCRQGRCACRHLDADEAREEPQIPAGRKRFELRLPRSTSAIWVEVKGRGVYYKPGSEVDPACVYIDLPPGRHDVLVHAENRDREVGLQTGLTVYEYARVDRPGWYRSFHLACGHAGSRCTVEGLEAWKAFQARQPRGVLDPCGSVMVKNVSVGGTRAGRHDREYQDLTVRFSLSVYEFTPYRPPGSAECSGPIRNR